MSGPTVGLSGPYLRPSSEVVAAMEVACSSAYNAGSQHSLGRKARRIILAADDALRALIGRPSDNVIYTGSLQEAWALAVFGAASARREKNDACYVIVVVGDTSVPPPLLHVLLAEGFAVTQVHAHDAWEVMPESIAAVVASAMVGTMGRHQMPLSCLDNHALAGIPVIVDLGAYPLHAPIAAPTQAAWTYLIDSAELGGPSGIGAVVKPRALSVQPLYAGGGQMDGARPGTEAIVSIAGLGAAAAAATNFFRAERQKGAIERAKDVMGLLAPSLGTPLFLPGKSGFLPNRLFFSCPILRFASPSWALRRSATVVVAVVSWDELRLGLGATRALALDTDRILSVTWDPRLNSSALAKEVSQLAHLLEQIGKS